MRDASTTYFLLPDWMRQALLCVPILACYNHLLAFPLGRSRPAVSFPAACRPVLFTCGRYPPWSRFVNEELAGWAVCWG